MLLNYRYSAVAGVRYAAVLLFVFVFAAKANAAPAIMVGDGPVRYESATWYDVLRDHGAALRIEDVVARATAKDFRPATPSGVNHGFTRDALWAHFSLHFDAASSAPMLLLLPRPLLDEVTLYTVIDGRVVATVETGDSRPFPSRSMNYRGFAFELASRPGTTVDYYLTVRSRRSASSVPLKLMDALTFSRGVSRENFLIGAYFGIAGALVTAALLLWMTLRKRIFATYLLYIGAFTLTVATVSGYGMQLLWPLSTNWQQIAPSLFSTLTLVLGVMFLRLFLRLPETAPRLDRLACAIAVTGAIGFAVHFWFDSQLGTILVIVSAAAICPAALIIAAVRQRAGDPVAPYFLFGWLVLMTGIGATALHMLGLVPGSVLNAYGLYFGSLAEFIALALALGNQVHRQNRQREAAVASSNAELAALNRNLESLVMARTAELEARNRELGELAVRDGLTGLYNHSTTIELLEQLLLQAQRYGHAITVLMADIDHFKQINDRRGHPVGDKVIEAVSLTLADAVRDSDVVGRYGGEEFLVIMPHADATAARELGERILTGVRGIEVPGDAAERVSISVGVAVANPHERVNSSELIERADAALYRAKRAGRDRLKLHAVSMVDPDDTVSGH